jgi:mRNA interferase RelE/StbE
MRHVSYSRSALKALRRMPKSAAVLVLGKIRQYADDPSSLANNVVKLQGRDGLRLRVGDWRIIFEEDGTVLAILEIGPRGSIYE